MKYLFIGNKIQDLGGFTPNKLQDSIRSIIEKRISQMDKIDDLVITSLNLGIETWAAECAYKYGVPYKVYIPCNNFHSKWIQKSKNNYTNLIKFAKDVKLISKDNYTFEAIKTCNITMLTEAEKIIGFFNEHVYAFKQVRDLNKEIENLMPIGEDNDYHITL